MLRGVWVTIAPEEVVVALERHLIPGAPNGVLDGSICRRSPHYVSRNPACAEHAPATSRADAGRDMGVLCGRHPKLGCELTHNGARRRAEQIRFGVSALPAGLAGRRLVPITSEPAERAKVIGCSNERMLLT